MSEYKNTYLQSRFTNTQVPSWTSTALERQLNKHYSSYLRCVTADTNIQSLLSFSMLKNFLVPRLCSKENWREPSALNLSKSRVPSIWSVWKIWDFLVARRQKLGAGGHRALLEHSPELSYILTLNDWSKVCNSKVTINKVKICCHEYNLWKEQLMCKGTKAIIAN